MQVLCQNEIYTQLGIFSILPKIQNKTREIQFWILVVLCLHFLYSRTEKSGESAKGQRGVWTSEEDCISDTEF